MFHTLKGYLRGFSRNGFTLSVARTGCAALLALLLVLMLLPRGIAGSRALEA